jgi:hypothetical protein
MVERDAFGWRMLDNVRRDGKHAVRRLVKDWRFSAAAVLILALGIGAKTTILSVVQLWWARRYRAGAA